MHAIVSEDEVLSIVAVVDNFTTFLTDEETYHEELCLALGIPLEKGRAAMTAGEQEKHLSHRYDSLLRQRRVATPQLVPIHRVASGAKNFLHKLLGDLPQVGMTVSFCCIVIDHYFLTLAQHTSIVCLFYRAVTALCASQLLIVYRTMPCHVMPCSHPLSRWS